MEGRSRRVVGCAVAAANQGEPISGAPWCNSGVDQTMKARGAFAAAPRFAECCKRRGALSTLNPGLQAIGCGPGREWGSGFVAVAGGRGGGQRAGGQ